MAQVQPLVKALRSCKLQGAAKEKKKKHCPLPTEVYFVVRWEKSTRELLSLVLNFETNILIFTYFLKFFAARRLSVDAMPWLLTACGAQALGAVGFSSCGTWA